VFFCTHVVKSELPMHIVVMSFDVQINYIRCPITLQCRKMEANTDWKYKSKVCSITKQNE